MNRFQIGRLITKFRNAASMKGPNAELFLSILEQTFLDAYGFASDEEYKKDWRFQGKDARRFIGSRKFYYYLSLIGVDEDYARFAMDEEARAFKKELKRAA